MYRSSCFDIDTFCCLTINFLPLRTLFHLKRGSIPSHHGHSASKSSPPRAYGGDTNVGDGAASVYGNDKEVAGKTAVVYISDQWIF